LVKCSSGDMAKGSCRASTTWLSNSRSARRPVLHPVVLS
jgi:hypothetical protein